ncbi:MAG: hypothetical protein A2Z21_08805 [Candidatus Fraserbacteria bacterium RBG_16_55_9]|uniref:Histidine kinase/HSP90-like ATPase domain-containing protein n=1 Tax=Fraserbacteria sp. (strain RBG_16_55_9) TaxID=1817864 RepID=A0A1F5V0F0_FRAXR|nr:MAG: hypothetical protein A2Z21_08805 [Candidatus Fraserbacteria bacterium RBG_16_55_9]
MDQKKLFDTLLSACTKGHVAAALDAFEAVNKERADWAPIEGKENNRGPIDVASDPGRALVERVTNAIDAILEAEHDLHGGIPDCRSPREAATTWIGIPERGLYEMSTAERQRVAGRVTITLSPGDGQAARLVDIRDCGVGLTPEEMPQTILSLNESNKIRKHYLSGTYGQGGSSTFAISAYTFIASRRASERRVGFTVVKYLNLPPEEYKTGHYVYLTLEGAVPSIDLPANQFTAGTLVRHFGYDLTGYDQPVGPKSVYGLLNQVLFDPVIPIWLDNQVRQYRRVIKGSRNALNGAVDEGDESRRGPSLDHNVPMFYVSLGDFGMVGFEYWILERPTKEKKRPSAAFVNPSRPIVLTLNGQNHAELAGSIVRTEAQLLYLSQRLVAHVDCNRLAPESKRALFASSREEARRGLVRQMIHDELVRILKSADELTRLNNEARDQGTRERDETAIQEMRREVARLLRIQGITIDQVEGGQARGDRRTPDQPSSPPGPHIRPQPIEVQEPPSYIRILWDEEEPISFYPGQRRYIRIETDANSTYHNPDRPGSSRINIIAQGAVMLKGSTPLRGGRLRAVLDVPEAIMVGANGILRVELSRPGLTALSDQREIVVSEKPPVRPGREQLSLPPFLPHPVAPNEERWTDLGWPEDVATVASSAEMENGTLVIYYSTAYPRYSNQLAKYEQRSAALAESFTKRYEVWLATHSLLYYRDQQEAGAQHQAGEVDEDEVAEVRERKERCRMATLAALFAAREVGLEAVAPSDAEGQDL